MSSSTKELDTLFVQHLLSLVTRMEEDAAGIILSNL